MHSFLTSFLVQRNAGRKGRQRERRGDGCGQRGLERAPLLAPYHLAHPDPQRDEVGVLLCLPGILPCTSLKCLLHLPCPGVLPRLLSGDDQGLSQFFSFKLWFLQSSVTCDGSSCNEFLEITLLHGDVCDCWFVGFTWNEKFFFIPLFVLFLSAHGITMAFCDWILFLL